MGEDYYKNIFSKNLKKYMELNGKEQIDLINDLEFNKSSVSAWCNGTRLPRMDKVNKLANYFGINRSDLIEEKSIESTLTPRDAKQIEQIIQKTKESLTNQEGLMFDGKPATQEAIDSIINAIEIGMEIAKKKNKEKYTPKKYKKD